MIDNVIVLSHIQTVQDVCFTSIVCSMVLSYLGVILDVKLSVISPFCVKSRSFSPKCCELAASSLANRSFRQALLHHILQIP